MKRIICLGNPFVEADKAGPLVFENLTARQLPEDISVIDGGLAGLDLVRLFTGCSSLVLVDSLQEETRLPNGLALFSREETAELAQEAFGHGAGLPYLLKILPAILDSEMPEIAVLGIQPPYSRERIEAAARLCLELVARPTGICSRAEGA